MVEHSIIHSIYSSQHLSNVHHIEFRLHTKTRILSIYSQTAD